MLETRHYNFLTMQIDSRNFKQYESKMYEICGSVSKRSGIPIDNLVSSCNAQIPNILKNYNAALGKDFMKFFASSIKGYALNHVRDNESICKVPRGLQDMCQLIKKYPTYEAAAKALKMDVDKIKELVYSVDVFKNYNMLEYSSVNEIFFSDTDTSIEFKEDCRDFVDEYLSDEEFDVLEDLYVNKLTKRGMNKKYGVTWGNIAHKALSKVKSNMAEDFFNEKRIKD